MFFMLNTTLKYYKTLDFIDLSVYNLLEVVIFIC